MGSINQTLTSVFLSLSILFYSISTCAQPDTIHVEDLQAVSIIQALPVELLSAMITTTFPSSTPVPMLYEGSTGQDVTELQEILFAIELLDSVSGIYDEATKKAVETIQSAYDIPKTGTVDIRTMEAVRYVYLHANDIAYIARTGKGVFHSDPTCSQMNDPDKVTVQIAVRRKLRPCKKCYGYK